MGSTGGAETWRFPTCQGGGGKSVFRWTMLKRENWEINYGVLYRSTSGRAAVRLGRAEGSCSVDMFRPHTAILSCYRILSSRSCCSVMPIFAYVMLPAMCFSWCCAYSITTEDGRVRPKNVLIEFKKWVCYIDGQKNKYSVLNECNRMLKYNIYNIVLLLL
jgi:hypothetical protein